ncbi:formimidoylglutamate deiminase [Saccharopolyspora cebuensis]|uniref:Formimidoylglutamate deiminase n=1 Tax=Saccharopolyspora cebuensis TaxID=418759 RepID=A0ABV4CE49_9PSEU
MTAYWCERAWLPTGPAPAVLLDVDGDRITAVRPGAEPGFATRLTGLVVPGAANAHSHAFHRALRGAGGPGTFWTWRDRMYRLARRLDPDRYHRLARAAYAEMLLAGYTAVGEFHYVHHAPGGTRYADPNAMGEALLHAARDAGIRCTLLDTCYLAGGFGTPLDEPQLRFSDGDAHAWAERVDALRPGPGQRIGAAVHSVRAVPAEQIPHVVDWARHRGAPLHAHLSEQPAENTACRAAHGTTPTGLLAARGALDAEFTAVHATHLTDEDVTALGGAGVCLCPTTEADLADGIGPAGALAAAGATLSIGSDGHSAVDPWAEAQAVEAGQRLATGRRGHFTPAALLGMATAAGHRALGMPGGALAPGAPADLVALDLGSARLAGVELTDVPAVARAADVRDVVVGGEHVVRDRAHRTIDVPAALRSAIDDLREDP